MRDPETSLRLAAESAIRHEIGSSDMETATTSAREQIALDVMTRLQKLYGFISDRHYCQ